MANSKISGLSPASTPLAGTETLPIVQLGATVKVPTNDLTVRNIRAAATTGILQVSGPTAGTTRTATVPDANWTAARTDSAQSFTGDQTLNTGNLIQGTAAKGINFTANTPSVGMTLQLLNWYEEGTWTPVISENGFGINPFTASGVIGKYTRIGNLITAYCLYPYTNKGSGPAGNYSFLTGLPFTNANTKGWAYVSILQPTTDTNQYAISIEQSDARFTKNNNNSGAGLMINSDFPSAGTVVFTVCYLS